ncbi:MAG: glucose-6-phosphate isomerase [Verrucomicrobiae bacterium]|nr:glucose-6-phosphate isomerase [Verrucomicrobiae bacterium]
MHKLKQQSWERFKQYYTEFPSLGLALDLSQMSVSEEFFLQMEARMQRAFADMAALEGGGIANPDEERMVGHYWLRNPCLAPTPEIRQGVEDTITQIKMFANDVHSGTTCGFNGKFKNLLLIGIGGSALGPQFVTDALGHPLKDKIKPYFFDNTDPDGMLRTLDNIREELGQTLCLVISKSGGTKETRNGMLEAKTAYEVAGLDFGKHSVAITRQGSGLDDYATANGWIRRFPMWDWVGGRTSVLSAVGLLPAALQGIKIEELLLGAKACDEVTRLSITRKNPSAMLALAWYQAGNGCGEKNMVVIPYKDRLDLFSRYLQQLIMESLGKESDLDGKTVNQGISVFGNKGATDQHSYIQQLRDGLNDFFVSFIEVLKDHDESHSPVFVEPVITSGDYLHGFYLGTRHALAESDRESLTITVRDISAFSIGALIALFERAVGLYASLVHINAYHQPGVEAGKRAAGEIIALEGRILDFLGQSLGTPHSVSEIAKSIGAEQDCVHTFKILEHLSANASRAVARFPSPDPLECRYSKV